MRLPAPPLVSVILPIYNAGEYLREAIESILGQAMQDFELILIDDCSTDNSLAVARSYLPDSRVLVLANDTNRGRAYSDNRGHALAKGRYIAKMDADDVALPQRLHVQVAFLEAHPETALVGSFLQTFGNTQLVFAYPVGADAVRSYLLFDMPVGNPSVTFRRSLVADQALAYDETIRDTFGEDYEWIARVSQVARIDNQPQVLLRYRTFPAALKAGVHARRTAKSNLIRERVLRRAGFHCTARELQVHNAVAHYPFQLAGITLAEVESWLLSLERQNQLLGYAAPHALLEVLADRWWRVCYHNPDLAVDSYRAYQRSILARQRSLNLQVKFWLKNKVLRHWTHRPRANN